LTVDPPELRQHIVCRVGSLVALTTQQAYSNIGGLGMEAMQLVHMHVEEVAG
jgi:hypothetical protein